MDPRCVGALAEERLRSNPYLALKNISCEYKEGILTLRGCLPTYYLRQMAQAAVAGLEGVQTVIDCIEVVPPALRGPRFP
jgi:osmotically-inducible protein OsmY